MVQKKVITDSTGIFKIRSKYKLSNESISVKCEGYFNLDVDISSLDTNERMEIQLQTYPQLSPGNQYGIGNGNYPTVGQAVCEPVLEEKKWWQIWK